MLVYQRGIDYIQHHTATFPKFFSPKSWTWMGKTSSWKHPGKYWNRHLFWGGSMGEPQKKSSKIRIPKNWNWDWCLVKAPCANTFRGLLQQPRWCSPQFQTRSCIMLYLSIGTIQQIKGRRPYYRGTGETIQMVDGMGFSAFPFNFPTPMVPPNFSDFCWSFPGEAMNFRTGSIPTDVRFEIQVSTSDPEKRLNRLFRKSK